MNAPGDARHDFRGLGFTPGDVVIVTGAGSGIGRAVARAAARAGLVVAACDRSESAAISTADEIVAGGGRGEAIVADVGDEADVRRMVETSARLGPCRYLVNNAGPPSVSTEPFLDALGLAVGSVHQVTTAWIEANGAAVSALVNVASTSGTFTGGGVQDFYAAAKSAIAGLTRQFAVRFGGRPRANAVAPGFVLTPRTVPYLDRADIRSIVDRNPLGRAGDPEEVAAAVCFLLSPSASYVNGALLPVDGGSVLLA